MKNLILAFTFAVVSFLISVSAQAQIFVAPQSNLLQIKGFSIPLNQNAGTYDLTTSTGGDILIKSVTTFVVTAGTGLTSVAIQTNNTSTDIIMSGAAGLLTNLTGGKNITAILTPIVLPSTKKIQYTIVGNGTGGTLMLMVEFSSPNGGTLS